MGKLGEVLKHPDELIPLVGLYIAAKKAAVLPKDPDLAFCYSMLNRVSRSFAMVIQQLPAKLRDAICVFYLVLRALDTVEDDMALPIDIKLPLLREFYKKNYEEDWSMECGTGHYLDLMKEYPTVCAVFRRLAPEYQDVITDICRRMGDGMAEFIEKEVETTEDFDLYCHYVAGLVGIGLSKLFASSGLEGKEFEDLDTLSNSMGLFLQKTNIIRDYLEDINEEPAPRMFWPKEIWGKHAERLADFKDPGNAEQATACLNDMIANALGHADDALDYMQRLSSPTVFRFCAIPQIMALGTLALCFDNHGVFEGMVKMRRGETAKIMQRVNDFADLVLYFRYYAGVLQAKAEKAKGEGAERVAAAARRLTAACAATLADLSRRENQRLADQRRRPLGVAARVLLVLAALVYMALAYNSQQLRDWLAVDSPPAAVKLDYYNQIVASMFLGYSLYAAATGVRP